VTIERGDDSLDVLTATPTLCEIFVQSLMRASGGREARALWSERDMPVDNELYDRLADGWWDPGSFLYSLRSALNPVRVPYLRRTMVDEIGIDPVGANVLDVGCGGGLLAEEFAAIGCYVTGIDPSLRSLDIARAHAAEVGLTIDYQYGVGESLPFSDGTFDAVYCCDVLEHVVDVRKVIVEMARVLRPGGVVLYDTINRTLRSKLIMIKLFQEWERTRFMEPDVHDWHMFIRPREVRSHLAAAGVAPGPITGIAPDLSPRKVVSLLRARQRGKLNFGEFGARMAMRESRDQSVLYAGYAIKPV